MSCTAWCTNCFGLSTYVSKLGLKIFQAKPSDFYLKHNGNACNPIAHPLTVYSILCIKKVYLLSCSTVTKEESEYSF